MRPIKKQVIIQQTQNTLIYYYTVYVRPIKKQQVIITYKETTGYYSTASVTCKTHRYYNMMSTIHNTQVNWLKTEQFNTIHIYGICMYGFHKQHLHVYYKFVYVCTQICIGQEFQQWQINFQLLVQFMWVVFQIIHNSNNCNVPLLTLSHTRCVCGRITIFT